MATLNDNRVMIRDKRFESLKKVSVVVEASDTDQESSHSTVIDTLQSLVRQNYPQESVEIIVCQFGWDNRKKRSVREQFPTVRILTKPNGGYFRLKNLGIGNSTGDIIALADSDCVYSPDWISGVVDVLRGDAAVSVGLTVYSSDKLSRRLCAFYNFYHMMLRVRRRTRRFLSNNVAFKSEAVKPTAFDGRFERSGGCVQLADRLHRSGVRMEFNPQQIAVHNFYGFHTHVWQRAIRNGYDIFYTRGLHPEMPLGTLTRLHFLAPPILYGIFVLSDVYNLFQNRRLLKARWYEVPVYLFFSAAVRSIEVIGMYWTVIHSKSVAEYVSKQ